MLVQAIRGACRDDSSGRQSVQQGRPHQSGYLFRLRRSKRVNCRCVDKLIVTPVKRSGLTINTK